MTSSTLQYQGLRYALATKASSYFALSRIQALQISMENVSTALQLNGSHKFAHQDTRAAGRIQILKVSSFD